MRGILGYPGLHLLLPQESLRALPSTSRHPLNIPWPLLALRQPHHHRLLNLGIGLRLLEALLALPIHVGRDISPVHHRVLYILHWGFLLAPEAREKDGLGALVVLVVLGAQATVVLEDVGVPSWSIALIVKSGGLARGTGRHSPRKRIGVTIELNAGVAHAVLEFWGQTAIIPYNLVVATRPIPVVVHVLGVESPLHRGKALVRLSSAREVHRGDVINIDLGCCNLKMAWI